MSRNASVLTSAIAVLAAAVVFAGPDPRGTQAPGSGIIAGQVLEAATNQPAPNALVQLSGRGIPVQRVLVDPRGRYVFRGLPAGVFAVSATRLGSLGGGADVKSPLGAPRPIELRDGERVVDLTLRLWTLGVISGTVATSTNEPIVAAEVRALRRSLVGGSWQFVESATTTTDDRGKYRIGNLLPGDYAVVALPEPNPETALLSAILMANPTSALDVLAGTATTGRELPSLDPIVRTSAVTFHGGLNDPRRATLVAVAADKERAGIDITFIPTRGVRVSGTLTNIGGAGENVVIRLVPADADAAGLNLDAATAGCDANGYFEFSAVPPGRYVVKVVDLPPLVRPDTPGGPAAPAPGGARPGGPPNPPPQNAPLAPSAPTGPSLWANTPVVVGAQDVAKVVVPLRRGVVVSGHVRIESAAAAAVGDAMSQVSVWLDAADATAPREIATYRWRVDAQGRFSTMGVPPGRYFVRVATTLRNTTARSATLAGRDFLDVPLDVKDADVSDIAIALSDRPMAVVTGAVRTADGAPAANATVVIFPRDRELWADSSATSRRLRLMRVTRSGTYGFQNLPDGDYLVAAVTDDLSNEWQDPQRLATLSTSATGVLVERGESHTVDLKVVK